MTKDELAEILKRHREWIIDETQGQRADLSGADLSGADLSDADLRYADLRRAVLRDADLRRADLRDADLSDADLRRADLRDAALRRAVLRDADLRRADLRRADLSDAALRRAVLRDAVLRDADLRRADLSAYSHCPEEGAFIGWKKVSGGAICKLEIPADAKRTSSLVGRKCRAEFVRVIEGEGDSLTDPHECLHYKPGEIVKSANGYSDDIRVECDKGIHFFITRQEAVDFSM